jgi:gas vesicle protein
MSTTAFFAGLVAGIGTGLLLAPQSGVRTRRQLHNMTQDLQEETRHMLGDAKTSIGKAIEQGKGLVVKDMVGEEHGSNLSRQG